MVQLETIRNAKHDTVKSWVLKALSRMASGRSSQHTLVSKICSMHGVTSLRGTPRDDFRAKVNKAISAMLREKQPRIKRAGSGGEYVKLIQRKRPRTPARKPVK